MENNLQLFSFLIDEDTIDDVNLYAFILPNEVIEIIENITENSSIFLLGTPREGTYLIDPLEIHRKNINIFGGHELNGHSWQNRNSCFIDLLKKNRDKELKKFVNIYNETPNIVNNVLQRKNNFFEVVKYDI